MWGAGRGRKAFRWARPVRTPSSLNMCLCTDSLCTLDENQGIGYNLKAAAGSAPGGLHGLQHCLMMSFSAASLLVPRAAFQ